VAALAIGLANCYSNELHVMHTRSTIPGGWVMGDRAPSSAAVRFTMALKQRNLDKLEAIFWAVSDPASPDYQNFMTKDQINQLTAPRAKDRDYVVRFLRQHGVVDVRVAGPALEVRTTVAVAERLFATVFYKFSSSENGKVIVKSWGSYSLPKDVLRYVEMVAGLSTFPVKHYAVQHARDASTGPEAAQQAIVPQTLTSFYSVRATTSGASPTTSQGVVEFEQQYFANADLTTFGADVAVKIPLVADAHVVGTNDPTDPQTESALDVCAMFGLNNEATSWFWIEDGDGWLYTWATEFNNATTVPDVVSISYGWWEQDQCDISSECSQLGVDSIQFVVLVNTEFQKVGVRGTSIVVSSGDSGAHGRTDYDCTAPQLRPEFPSSSPYVTSVGATQIVNALNKLPSPPPICANYSCPSSGTEQAVSYDVAGFTSGGGFSAIANTPSYQQAAVTAYLNSGVKLPPSSFYNATGRGSPDISAVGINNLIIQDGVVELVGGTSAASPEVGGVISLLNQISYKKTNKPLGFANPFLYAAFAADATNFQDITVGDNICTEAGCSASCVGFTCTKGWDPVTGLGTPNYTKLAAYLNSMLDSRV